MTTNFDKENLTELMSKFYLLTGIKIVVYDTNLNIIAAMPEYDSEFCSTLKKNKKALTCCDECTKKACLHAKSAKSIYLYRCHAGLIEAVTPLFINDGIVGYLVLGQILNKDDKETKREEIIKYASSYSDNIKDAFSKLTVKDSEHIQAAVKIMEMCACYLLIQNLIKVDKETLALKISAYIEENISSFISVSTLCKEFSLSHNRLYNIFEDFFGMPVAKYIRKFRIKKAKQLISDGVSITETAIRVGFCDYSYFSKVFKAETGILPTKFKNNNTIL